ncbi:hypothetical protein SISNIDRAFT_454650, partial [Sistotremastrum niveocremeum HHB9708]
MSSPPYAFVTLLTSDAYLPGALTLAAALRDLHPSPPTPPETDRFQIICLVTPESVGVGSIKLLRKAFDVVIGVEIIDQLQTEGLKLLGRPDLHAVLTKLHVFRLTSYSKLLFLDADVLPLQPLSHLFALRHEFAAVPDVGWPDIFNSGVMLLEPGEDKFQDIMSLVRSKGSWDGGDQGVLNEWRGSNWHRLSFTYNTTPTAAYTYAPAYTRFGSQIKAIHFIGPNKPWSSLPYRESSSTSTSEPSTAPQSEQQQQQSSYAYNDLVDRWYGVYDGHYRSEGPPPAQETFQVQKYQAAWDSGPGSSSSSNQPMGLDELRQAALTGIASVTSPMPVYQSLAPPEAIPLPRSPVHGYSAPDPPTTHHAPAYTPPSHTTQESGEGQYYSLPLEGRFDLMRPRIPTPPPAPEPETQTHTGPDGEPDDDNSDTPRAVPSTPLRLPVRSVVGGSSTPVRMDTLPTPGPAEVPPAPLLRTHSLPPATPSPTPSRTSSIFAPTPLRQSQHHEPAPEHRQEHRHEPPPRPISPPLLIWNAAVDPPPSNPPPSDAFQGTQHFANVWDQSHRKHEQEPGKPESATTATDSAGFFVAPPPSRIPEHLLREGHYSNVTHQPHRHHHHASHGHHSPPRNDNDPQPDRSRVSQVFPWETKPRHAPARVFPKADSPPPEAVSNFIVPKPPSPPPAPAPKPVLHVQTASPQQSPPAGFPSSGSFRNAWDSVPSIQRYASRLQRPTPAPVPIELQTPPQSRRGGRRYSAGRPPGYKTWEERVETNSQEGDDEDEGDEFIDDEEETPKSVSSGDTSLAGSAESLKRARRVSGSSQTRDKATGKIYRTQGVQTVKTPTRDRGVQVSKPVDATPPPPPPAQITPPSSARSAKTSTSSTSSSVKAVRNRNIPMHLTMNAGPTSFQKERDAMVGTPSAVEAPDILKSSAARASQLASAPTSVLSRIEMTEPLIGTNPSVSTISAATSRDALDTTPNLSASSSTASNTSSIIAPVPRLSSDDTVLSQQSSIGPISPPEGQSLLRSG